MNSSKKYNVFISHSSKDKKISDLLCNLMIKAGLTVWYDENSMLPNTSLTTDIPKYISNSEVLLVVLSKNSCDSRWVEEEYNYAKELLYKQELKRHQDRVLDAEVVLRRLVCADSINNVTLPTTMRRGTKIMILNKGGQSINGQYLDFATTTSSSIKVAEYKRKHEEYQI